MVERMPVASRGEATDRMKRLLLALLLASAARAMEVDVLRVVAGERGPELQFVVGAATFGAPLPRVSLGASAAAAPALPARLARVSGSDCSAMAAAGGGELRGKAAVVDRGGRCSFFQAARAAERAGAALVVVRDSVAGAFESARRLGGGEIFDCALGEAAVARNASEAEGFPAAPTARRCADSRACESNTCVYTGRPAGDAESGAYQVCCFKNALVHMVDRGSEIVSIPAVFMSLRDGQLLEELMHATRGDVTVSALNAEENPWNPSMLVTWAIGVVTVITAAFYSSSDEREWSYRKVARRIAASSNDSESGFRYVAIDNRRHHQSDTGTNLPTPTRFEVTTRHALYFLVGASAMLLLLYYTHLHLVLALLFAIGASAALTQVVATPLWTAMAPTLTSALGDYAIILQVFITLVAPAIGIFWFVERTQPWIWPLQDLLCISLCIVCIEVVQLPSLRVASTLLAAAFVYDVFFVYISPLVFGANVMVDVASGNSVLNLSAQGHQEHATVPMVLVVPLLYSVYGGSALLGLGDIILPGLLVSFSIRYDYCKGTPLSRGYFSVATIAYAVGLLLANFMAIVLRDVVAGQPALMYIVPIMLAAVLGLSKYNGEWEDMWNGPTCLEMLSDDEAGEREPLLLSDEA